MARTRQFFSSDSIRTIRARHGSMPDATRKAVGRLGDHSLPRSEDGLGSDDRGGRLVTR